MINEISTQTKEIFNNLGNDINPILIDSEINLINNLNYLINTIKKGVECDEQVSAITL